MLINITKRGRRASRLLLVGLAAPALLLATTACAASSSASLDSSAQARKLALGTLRLEGTPQAVDSQSAAQLLQLWELMDELSTNSAAAPQEISAVVDQIRATMTTDQVGAIDDMTLGAADLADSPAAASSSTSSSGDTARMPMEAVVGGGGPPDGGGGIPGGEGMPPGPQGQTSGSTTESTTAEASAGVYRQVISLLQSKLQA